MATVTELPPLLVIVGETASGKSQLALELAKKFNGEIIAGDARTMYRGMDIGTAKPSPEDRLQVRHHLLDELNPNEPITAHLFKQRAQRAINDISQRGKLPILVGGSGLYIDSLLYDYSFNTPADPEERARLGGLSVEQLQATITGQGLALPENDQNPRHLIRVIETAGKVAPKNELRTQTLVLGVGVDRDVLRQRIADRVDQMLANGLENEVRRLVSVYGWDGQLGQTIGYKEFKNYLEGDENVADVRAAIIRDTCAYAKRQRTWFNRNQAIVYLSSLEQYVDLVTTWLNK
ncbi:MAG: tRNA (adenosine(37)-N6)-dimethylallyltransferase MiaA [Candidatus Saccharimonadales bacterium]